MATSSSLSEIWTLYRKELRSALRERSIVVNSVLVPILLYPAMLWIMLTGITFVMGLTEGLESRILLVDLPAAHEQVRAQLEEVEGVELIDAPLPVENALELLRGGELDAVVEFLPAEGSGAAMPDNFRARVSFDRSEEGSNQALQRIDQVIDDYREAWLEREAERLAIPEAELEQYRVVAHNVATSEEMGARVLGSMVPLFLVVMVALGCFIPAVDSTAGERERKTWETTMTVSASRSSIITAKYLYVATLGMVAGSLNVIAVTISLGPIFSGLTGGPGDGAFTFTIPLSAFPVMILGAGILALFFAAAMMILAAFARTFKDGQAMVTPVVWLALLPMLLGDSPDQRLNPQLAAIPIANVAMMIREAILGFYQPLLIAEVLAVGLVLVAVCLWIARRVMSFEELMMGSYDGSFWKFAKGRLFGRDDKEKVA